MSNVDLLSILLIAVGLSADCFAVALSSSFSRRTFSFLQVLRISLSFGIFQAAMPIIGWLAGKTIVEFISDYDHWIAFGLLAFIGGRMVWQSLHSKDAEHVDTDISKGLLLLTLSIATSIDAFAVGLSFAFLEINIILAVATIGVIAFLVTIIGLIIGKKVGSLVGKRAEIVGGVILIGIGLRILLEHML
ncbi:manganese efflux pump MntP family protein [Chloroflexota bacterium]